MNLDGVARLDALENEFKELKERNTNTETKVVVLSAWVMSFSETYKRLKEEINRYQAET